MGILCVCQYSSAKNPDREKVPRPEEFAKALYTFDIGQNDLSVGFRKLSSDQLKAALPDIIGQLAAAVKVSFKTCGKRNTENLADSILNHCNFTLSSP